MAFPLLIAGLGALAGFGLGGKGSPLITDVFTSKKQSSITTSNQTTYSPTITKIIDIQTASGGSTITSKKEQDVGVSPTVTPSLTVIPSQIQGTAGSSGESGLDIGRLIVVGGLVGAGLLIVKSKFKK